MKGKLRLPERKMNPKKVTKTNTTAKSRSFHPTGKTVKTINQEVDQFPLLSTKVNELRL